MSSAETSDAEVVEVGRRERHSGGIWQNLHGVQLRRRLIVNRGHWPN
jgi:hypothetical protein